MGTRTARIAAVCIVLFAVLVSSSMGAAQVGHSDRMGLSDTEQARSWNSSHATQGCSQQNLVGTGGAGLFYCFAGN